MSRVSDADLEVVSEFVDGECVAAPSLTAALATEDGREYLIDVLQLRQAARAARPQLQAHVAPRPRPRFRWLVAWSIPAMLTAAFATGYVVRGNQEQRRPDVVPAFLATDAIGTQGEPTAPAPSVVIKLEPGVSWFERTQAR